ncbi:hypothetical protein [Streptomyces iranensis]|uniref:hypothetical protein n=1 Tax=Streptomyces iranensis TaxID=576784 RepID=UPI0039B77976
MGDDIRHRNVNDRPVTNVISGGVNHGLVIQTGSFEGDVHVHAPPGQSAERESAMAELEQRLDAQERTERERQRRAQEQREAERRKEREHRRVRRIVERDAIERKARKNRAHRIKALLAFAFCLLGVFAFMADAVELALVLYVFGPLLILAIPTSALGGGRKINTGPSGRATPHADQAVEAPWRITRPPY